MRRVPLTSAVLAAVVLAFVLMSGRGSEPGDREPAIAVKKASFDSEAPVTAPAHWLPPEDWVYNHWLPYDEGRLYALLGVSRGAIWRQLRDDRHNLAQLAARHGWPSPQKLAAALVAPRKASVAPATFAQLRSRALRTITQGHLSQHLLFHSLHQFSIPSEAPEIFGVSDAQFRALRRGEQSPLEIGRLHGRSPSRVQARSAAVLRERVAFGTSTGAMSAAQGRLLLRRQISQLPRWLAQVRYNGPPPTHRGQLTRKPRNFAANPALTADGEQVVFEGYEQKLPVALKRGEISVLARTVGEGTPALNVSAQPDRRAPRSAYNPTVSGDGLRIAFEAAEGNLNFAKRYGRIRVFVADMQRGSTTSMAVPRVRAGVSLSAYNPVMAAGGRHVAYQAQRRGGQSAVYVTDLRTGRPALASRGAGSGPGADDGVYDPAISGDGRYVAFTTAASNLGGGDLRGRTQVFVRDVKARTTTLVSRASGARGAVANDYSADPAISRDGRYVAFSSAARNLGAGGRGSRTFVGTARACSCATCGRAGPSPSAARAASRSSRRSAPMAASSPTRRSPAAARGCSSATRADADPSASPRARPAAPAPRRTAARRTRRSPPTAGTWRSRAPRRTSRPASPTTAAASSFATFAAGRRHSPARRCPRPHSRRRRRPPPSRPRPAPSRRPKASSHSAARRCRARPSSRSSTTRSFAAATGRPSACAPAAS